MLLLKSAGLRALRSSAKERSEIVSRVVFAVESLLQVPRGEKIPQEQQDHLIKTIQEQIALVASNMEKSEENERDDAEMQKQSLLKHQDTQFSKATWERIQKMRDFRNRLNHQTTIGAKDFISKLKATIHFINKGALNGDEKASAGLDASLARMAQMLGQRAEVK